MGVSDPCRRTTSPKASKPSTPKHLVNESWASGVERGVGYRSLPEGRNVAHRRASCWDVLRDMAASELVAGSALADININKHASKKGKKLNFPLCEHEAK